MYLTAPSLSCAAGSLIFIVAGGIFSCGRWAVTCGIWNSWPGMEDRPPVSGAQNHRHRTTREVPTNAKLTQWDSSSGPLECWNEKRKQKNWVFQILVRVRMGMKQPELWHPDCGNMKCYNLYGQQFGSFLKKWTIYPSMIQEFHT